MESLHKGNSAKQTAISQDEITAYSMYQRLISAVEGLLEIPSGGNPFTWRMV